MARTIVRASTRDLASVQLQEPQTCDWPICEVQFGLIPFQKLTNKQVFHHCPQHHEAILVILRQRASSDFSQT